MDAVGPDDSEYDSSSDEYIPSEAEMRELEQGEMDDCPSTSRRKRSSRRKREMEWDEEDDIPLAATRQQDKDDVPLAALRQDGDWQEEDDTPFHLFC
ncbi:hypothetical protein ACOMHN_046081 [Nucella lapillus]